MTDKKLFNESEKANIASAAPLSVRMRPKNLHEFIGQRHFLGPDKLLTRILQADKLSSLIFYGPPGV
ncbi:MAG: replication-associated recombination protein A, partial [Phycisphaerae bacterium]